MHWFLWSYSCRSFVVSSLQYEKEVRQTHVETEDIPGAAVSHHIAFDTIVTSKSVVKIKYDDNKRPFSCNASVPYRDPVQLSILPAMICKSRLSTPS